MVNWKISALFAAAVTIPSVMYFTANGTGAVRRLLSKKLAETVSVCDFEDPCPSGGDDTNALQAAINAVKHGGTASERNLYIPAGTYNYSTQLLANQLRTIRVYGDGNRNTVLHWTGGAGGTAFLCRNCYRTVFEGIRFDRGANDPAIIVEVLNDSGQSDYDSSAPSQLNTFRECTFKNGGIGLSIDFATSDVMNDTHRVEHSIFDGQTTAAISITGANAMNINLVQNYSTNAPRAVQVLSPGGSFKWYGGYVNSSTSNFDFQSINQDGYLISGVRSESSPRFLSCSGGFTTSAPITIEGSYYSAANLNADTFAISSTCSGPYNIIGNTWGDTNNTPPRFSISGSQTIPVYIVGNGFDAAGSDAVTIISPASGNRIYMAGNRYKTAGLTRITKVESSVPQAGPAITTSTYATGSNTSLGSIDWSRFSWVKVVATDANLFGWDNPTGATDNQCVRYQIKNTSGGALNAGSPFGGGKFRMAAYTAPANTKNRTYTVCYDAGADTYYEARGDADVGN